MDTGAEVSVLPPSSHERFFNNPGPALVAANGSSIKTYGKRTVTIELPVGRFRWTFVLANVSKPLLGADFLRANSLLVDMQHYRLVNARSFTSTPLCKTNILAPRLNAISTSTNAYAQLLAEFSQISTPQFFQIQPKHNVQHFIVTQGPPVHSRARRLSPEKLALAKQEFNKMLDMGIIRRSSSPWASPLHLVPKPSGGWRPCGDYRRLNAATLPDRYSLPHIQDFAARLDGAKIFSKVDLIRGYHQVPVAEADICKTAVITPFGLFEFLRMPFGLKNAAQAFQRLMDTVCQSLDFVFVYLDDILIASSSHHEHQKHLKILFEKLLSHGLLINLEKCEFGRTHLDFLGHRIDKTGARPLATKVDAIRNFPPPKSTKDLQRFIGMINFYHRFIPSAAKLMAPLYRAIANNNKILEWSDSLQTSFTQAKQALANATLLHYPKSNAPTAVTVDASDVAIGAVLEQFTDGAWQPLAFFSRMLRKPEVKYSAFDRELLAIHLAIRHFRYFLDGRCFAIFTDHKPLTFAFSKISDPWSARQQRHLSAISEYTTDIRHIAGKQNFVADTLSRPTITFLHTPQINLNYQDMAADQVAPEVQAYRTAITNLRLEDIPIGNSNVSLLCDVSTGRPRPIVPISWRRRVFDAIHGLSHPSIRATRKLVASKFVWHGLQKQVGLWTKQCLACQKAKIQRHVKAPIISYPPPGRRFDCVNIDIVGPLAPSEGNRFLLTMVDRFTRWPEAIPLKEVTTLACAKAFVATWVSRFGVPTHLSSDRGSQFISQLWSSIHQLLGIRLHHTTAYHPQANGLVERFHRQLKTALMTRLTGANWVDELPWVLLGIRTTPKEDINCSTAELVYGSPLTVPGDFIPGTNEPPNPSSLLPWLRQAISKFNFTPMSQHGVAPQHMPREIFNSPYVFIRRDSHKPPLTPPYEGPYKVLQRGTKSFQIDVGGREEAISVDRLKPAFVDTTLPVQLGHPKRRGRPPKS